MPPVYNALLPARRFPNAGSSENFDVAALLWLPLISNPSSASSGLCGGGAASSAAFFGAPSAARACNSGAGATGSVCTDFACANISSSGSMLSSKAAGSAAGPITTSCVNGAKPNSLTVTFPAPSARSAKL